MITRRKVLGLLLLMAAVMGLAGCPKPAKKIPESGQEPVLSLYVNESGTVKRINMEEYLQGVVAAEMDPAWPVNALAAQAILARTFTLKKMEQGGVKARGTDASTDVKEFQAYNAAKINDNVRQAVTATRGTVVTYKGKYINGWFFADAGGRTAASADEGLAFKEPAPYIKSVSDPGFAITEPENKAWTARFNLNELRAGVRDVTGQDPGGITEVKVQAKGPSGRATQLKVGKVVVGAPALRLALGSEKMRSTLLDRFSLEGGSLVMSGKGFGHGVGMSQWGARALAEQGKKPEDIISYFFRGIEIDRRW